MTDTWVQEKSHQFYEKAGMYPGRLIDIWDGIPEGYHYLLPQRLILLMRLIKMSIKHDEPILLEDISNIQATLEQTKSITHYNFDKDKEFFEKQCHLDKDQLYRFIDKLICASNECQYYMTSTNPYLILQDTPQIKMRGDIVIVNPKYVFIDRNPTEQDFVKNNIYGLMHKSIAQECGYKEYNPQKHHRLCDFITTNEAICVIRVEDALRMNKNFDNILKQPHLCTCIRDFKGSVQIKISPKTYTENDKSIPVFASAVYMSGTQNGAPISFSTWSM